MHPAELVAQVHFPRAVCLTGLKIGAVPVAGSFIHVFAHDLETRGSARFACLAEKCLLPDTSVKAVRVEVQFSPCMSYSSTSAAFNLKATVDL